MKKTIAILAAALLLGSCSFLKTTQHDIQTGEWLQKVDSILHKLKPCYDSLRPFIPDSSITWTKDPNWMKAATKDSL